MTLVDSSCYAEGCGESVSNAIARNGGPQFTNEDLVAVERVLDSGDVSHGVEVGALEDAFCELTGHGYSLAFNSWTSAAYAYLLYQYSQVGSGEVIIPSFTFAATGNVVLNAGFTPIFADIGPVSLALSPETVRDRIGPETRGIIVVHYAGIYDHENTVALKDLAESEGLFFLEDCAESLGATSGHSQQSGSVGDSCFSFYATKGISAGEGGMLSLEDEAAYAWLSRYRAHGVRRDSTLFWRRDAVIPGQNFRLANLNAALSLSQLRQLESFINKRRALASKYRTLLQNVDSLRVPKVPLEGTSWQMFPVFVPPEIRDQIVISLVKAGIGASVHFDPPLHLQTAFAQANPKELPFTESASKSVITLPMHTLLEQSDVEAIVSSLLEILDLLGR